VNSVNLDPATVEAYAGQAQIAIQEGDWEKAAYHLGIADLSGRSSYLLEESKAMYAQLTGDTLQADKHWTAAARTILWPLSSAPYFESVYSRAYLPMDLPPQTIQAPLPATIQSGYLEAYKRDEIGFAAVLYPWYEAQNLITDWLETAALEGLMTNE
jgi:hypothetical protein